MTSDYSSETPAGVKTVWNGQRPPEEGVPLHLPGVVVRELPDGWALVAWADRDGWQCPDAVYELKWLDEISEDEFDMLVSELRASDWGGLPPRTPFRKPTQPPEFRSGARVRWVGPLKGDLAWQTPEWREWYPNALGGILTPSHPGIVSAVADNGDPLIRWVDKSGEVSGQASVPREFVVEIDSAEAARRTERLRASEWPGLNGPGQ